MTRNPKADSVVEIVGDSAEADQRVSVVGDQVITATPADAGKTVQVAADGTLELADLSGTSAPYPRRVEIDLVAPVKAQTNFSDVAFSSSSWRNGRRQSTGAQNAEFTTYEVPIEAGTWRVDMAGLIRTDSGIATVYFDATEVGVMDFYSAFNSTGIRSITGITVASSGLKTVRVVMATKSASSSNYQLIASAIFLTRTA